MTYPAIDLTANTISAGGPSVRVPPTIAEVLVVLIKAAPGFVSLERLHMRLYGETGDAKADATLRVHLSRTNKFLRDIGYRIENVRALGWRIVRDEDATPPVPYERFAAVLAERDAALARLAGMGHP